MPTRFFDKDAENMHWRKDSLFNKFGWENWISECRKLKLAPCLSPCTSINSKWIKDLNIRPENFKLVQERRRNTLELIGIGNDFLSRTQMTQQLRERIDKWDYMKVKSFCTTKEMVSKIKEAAHRLGENLYQLYTSQGINNYTIQGAQKTKLPKKSMTQ
jgi:hypothetical protein